MRGKRRPTRRRKALCWLTLLILLAACLNLPGSYHFLPSQAIRAAERQGNIGPTQLITELPGEKGRTLRGNDRGLMVSTLCYKGLGWGWDVDSCGYLDCSGDAPFYSGLCLYTVQTVRPMTMRADWCGQINDPAAETIQLEVYWRGERQEDMTRTLSKEDWLTVEGRTCFVCDFPWEWGGWRENTIIRTQLFDGEGSLLSDREILLEMPVGGTIYQ